MQDAILKVPQYSWETNTLYLFYEACKDLEIEPIQLEGEIEEGRIVLVKVRYKSPESLFQLAILYDDKINLLGSERAQKLLNALDPYLIKASSERRNKPSEY